MSSSGLRQHRLLQNRLGYRFDRRHCPCLAIYRRQCGHLVLCRFSCKRLFLIFGQLLILLPLCRFLIGIEFFGTGVALTCHPPLVRRQRNPRAHAFLYAGLVVRLHRHIAPADFQPLRLVRRVELVPLGRQRRQCLLLYRGQFFPAWIDDDCLAGWPGRRTMVGC